MFAYTASKQYGLTYPNEATCDKCKKKIYVARGSNPFRCPYCKYLHE